MQNNPKVSIIIPCYNGEKFLSQAVESVLEQTYTNWELLLIDDGSTDKSRNVALKFLFDKRIRIIEHKKNMGIAATRNTGLKNATGSYIAFLDQDDVWLPEKIAKQVEVFQSSSSDTGMVCTGMSLTDKKLKPELNFKGYKDFNQRSLIKKMYLKPMNSGSLMMIRKSCFSEIGLFDNKYHGWDDFELWMRLATKYRIRYIREILVKKRSHDNNSQKLPGIKNKSEMTYSDVLKLHPFLNKYEKIRKAKSLYRQGVILIEQGRNNLARRKLKECIVINPIYLRVIILFILSFIPGRFSLYFRNVIIAIRNHSTLVSNIKHHSLKADI